ncbi:MAG TPA: AMP-binding protein [Thermoanaerobaculia bacterium]|nr:AMP-binding protein [Thermoanaerobaculia bacterium]
MDFLTAHAQRQPDRPAVVCGERVLDYAALESSSNRLAHAMLELGIRSGDRSTTVGYNAPEHTVVSSATRKLVVVGLPMSYRLNAEEIRYQLAHSETAIVFSGPEQVERVESALEACPTVQHRVCWGVEEPPAGWIRFDDLLARGADRPPAIEAGLTGPSMTYTAGTTGNPKGAYRAEGTDPSVVGSYIRWFDLRPGDVHLVAGPLYHSAPGAFAAFNTILGGANMLMPRFDPEAALQAIERHRVTTTFMAPILLQRIVHLPAEVRARHDLSSMRSIVMAAAPCPFEVKRRVMELFGEVLYEFYGSSELGCNAVMRPEDQLRKPGSCGRPCEGIEVKVLDDAGRELPPGEPGELYIKSPQVITEYWHNEEATRQARRGELFSVGDVGYLDDEGFLYISDRKRDMVISGGVNICTTEVENVIHAHPDVWDVAVFGVPSAEWGESVHAVVQPRPGARIEAETLLDWLRERLAHYKLPRAVELRDALPRDEAGKIRKRELREPFWQGRATRV